MKQLTCRRKRINSRTLERLCLPRTPTSRGAMAPAEAEDAAAGRTARITRPAADAGDVVQRRVSGLSQSLRFACGAIAWRA